MPNLMPRQHRFTIGGMDYTGPVISFDGADSKLPTGGGLIQFTGTAILGYPSTGWAESLDDRINQRWARGTPFNLDFQDDTATWNQVRGCRLFILEAVYRFAAERLELQLGDQLALLDYREPGDDQSGVCVGDSIPKLTVINRLLAAAGMGPAIGNIQGTLSAPAARLSGSYVSQAGQIAASEGYFLYIDRAGQARLKRIAENPQDARATITLRDEAIAWERLYGEQPAQFVEVQGQANLSSNNGTTFTESGQDLAPAAIAGLNSTTPIVSRDWQRTETLTADSAGNVTFRQIELVQSEPIGKLLPEDYAGQVGRITSLIRTEEYFYQATGSGSECSPEFRLVRKVVTDRTPLALAIRDVYNSYPEATRRGGGWTESAGVIAKRVTITYSYGSPAGNDPDVEQRYTGIVITEIEEQPAGAILPDEFEFGTSNQLTEFNSSTTSDSGGADSPYEARRNIKTWDENRLGEWYFSEYETRAINLADPDLADRIRETAEAANAELSWQALLAPITTIDNRNPSNKGNTQPPAPETPPALNSDQRVQVTGRAQTPVDTSYDYRQKTRQISMQYLSGASVAAVRNTANDLADRWAKIIWGRNKGTGLQTEFAQHWFDYEPFDRIELIEPEGRSSHWGDGFAIEVSEQVTNVGLDCIFRGWLEDDAPTSAAIPLASRAIFELTVPGHGFSTGDEVTIV